MARGIEVVEVDCPNRKDRHRAGKSDAIDAVSAARGALSRDARGEPKGGTGPVEAMRVLLIAKRSARAERVRALNQMRQMIYVAPDDIRAWFQGLIVAQLTRQTAAMRPRPGPQVDYVTLLTLRELAAVWNAGWFESRLTHCCRVSRLFGRSTRRCLAGFTLQHDEAQCSRTCDLSRRGLMRLENCSNAVVELGVGQRSKC